MSSISMLSEGGQEVVAALGSLAAAVEKHDDASLPQSWGENQRIF